MNELPSRFSLEPRIGPWLWMALASIGTALLLVTAIGLWRRSQTAGDWIQTTGRVVGFEEVATLRTPGDQPGETERPGRVANRSSFPIIEFTDNAGTVHRFASRLGAIDGTLVELGIRYRASNPADAEVAHGFAQGGWMFVTGGLGSLLIAIGWFLRDKL